MTEAFYRIKDGSAAVNLFRDLINTISLHDMNTYLDKRLVLEVLKYQYTSPAFDTRRLDLYIHQGLIFYINMCSYHVTKKLY